MPIFAHISRLVSLFLGGLVLATIVELPTWTLPLIVLDSPLTIQLSSPWFIAAMLVILVCAGTDVLLQLHPGRVDIGLRHTAPALVLPGMVAAAAPLLIARFEPFSTPWRLILLGAGIGLSLALLVENHMADPYDRHFRAARAASSVLVYGMALLLFTAIYAAHVRTVLSGSATMLISFPLAATLFHRPAAPDRRVWPYAAITALVVGLATWGLNHLYLDGLVGGGLLLLLFYSVTGVIQHVIRRTLSWRILIEFAAAAVLGLLLIGLSARGG